MLSALGLLLASTVSSTYPSDQHCGPLPAPKHERLPFRADEKLLYDVDLLGGGLKIGRVSIQTLPPRRIGGTLAMPVHAEAQSVGTLPGVGRVDSTATSNLRVHDLHPFQYREDYEWADGKYWTEVSFPSGRPHQIKFKYGQPNGTGERAYPYGNDALEVVGAFYLVRSLDLSVGKQLCFDLYGARHVWRVWGSVIGHEEIATPAGHFQTVALDGYVARVDNQKDMHEIHVWVSDDDRHLPVAGMGDLDFGPMRALLTGVESTKPDAGSRAAR
jgi:hypothetical protein